MTDEEIIKKIADADKDIQKGESLLRPLIPKKYNEASKFIDKC